MTQQLQFACLIVKLEASVSSVKYADLPEGINTPELVSAYLAGVNHHASLAIGDPEDPLSEALYAAC